MIKKPGEELGDNDICIDEPGVISYKVWIKSGSMLINRECLDIKSDLHIYNLVVAHGLIPEDYGLVHPHVEEFASWSRSQLVNEIVKLRDSLHCAAQYGFL